MSICLVYLPPSSPRGHLVAFPPLSLCQTRLRFRAFPPSFLRRRCLPRHRYSDLCIKTSHLAPLSAVNRQPRSPTVQIRRDELDASKSLNGGRKAAHESAHRRSVPSEGRAIGAPRFTTQSTPSLTTNTGCRQAPRRRCPAPSRRPRSPCQAGRPRLPRRSSQLQGEA